MDKIIFLDIDGPIINTPMYFIDAHCSLERSVMNTQSIGYVKDLCRQAKAKIVCNSTHNTHDVEDRLTGAKRNLKQDLIYWGFKEEEFHSDWHTMYPFPNGSKLSMATSHRRLLAIDEWQEKNGEVDWIAFDDEKFTDDKRLVLIHFDLGIDRAAFLEACDLWNLKQTSLI